MSLKNYLKREIERLLTNVLREKKTDPENDNIKINEVKIAEIVFAFNNSQLINLLKQRGAAIINQKYDTMREIEKKITDLKKDNYEDFTRPVCAFITFEEEDSYIIAQDFEPEFDWIGRV